MIEFESEKKEMLSLTQKYVDKLTGIWKQIFQQEMCGENLRKLVTHATNFYGELVEESLSHKKYIQNEIDDLKKEAENLKRLLKTDIQLPSYDTDEVPLLMVQSELDKSLEGLREQLRLRKEQICELLLEQEALCEELGEPPRALLADPLPTAEEIDNFSIYLESLRDKKVERINRISTMRREIKHFLQLLELQVSTETEDRLLNHRQIKMNKETFDGLKRMHDCYEAQVKELKDTIDGMRKKLHTLWERLNASPNTRNKFDRYNDYNQHTYEVFYGELQRCETLKSQNIKLFVQQIRDEITKWWDKTLKSETQKSRFSHFLSNCYTDDLLVLHEMELEDLKLYYETNVQIFELFADRNILWDRMCALEAKASEPGRYNNRGGQLLKEEKERKTIATKLPKIELQIRELVEEYQKREHAPFLVYGENIIDVMTTQWEQKRKDKETMQSARKNAGKTPARANKTNSIMRTPMSVKNASSVSSLRKTPSTISLAAGPNTVSSQKRKLNPTEKFKPVAKRSLMQALNSPSIFLKPSTSKSNIQHTASSLATQSKNNNSGSNFKSPHKKTKLVATTIRRRSFRHSGNLKKRRTTSKNPPARPIPKIVVDPCQSDGYSTDYNDDTYDSFEKCIEPASRSSVIHNITTNNDSTRTKRMQKIVRDENTRLAKLPKPRSPTKKQYHHSSISNLTRTPTHNNHHSPASATTGRKLTTKNLPIII